MRGQPQIEARRRCAALRPVQRPQGIPFVGVPQVIVKHEYMSRAHVPSRGEWRATLPERQCKQ